MQKNRTLMRGYYGRKNVGDDVFLLVTDWAAKRIFNLHNVNVFGENLPVLKHIKKLNFSHYRIVPFLQVRTEIIKSKNILYVGGSTFNKAVTRLLDERRLFFFKRCFALGISIGPFKDQKAFDYVKRYLETFKYISVRDERSMQFAKQMQLNGNVHKTFDVAAILPLIDEDTNYCRLNSTPVSEKNNIVGVSVCHYEKFYDKLNLEKDIERIDYLTHMIKTLSKFNTGLEFRFFVFNGNEFNGDIMITQEIVDDLNRDGIRTSIVNYTSDTLKFWNLLKVCNLFLGFRLHSGIMAYMANIPFILFEYHQKCTDFLDHIGFRKEFRVQSLACLEDVELQNKLNSLIIDATLQLTSLKSAEATTIAYNDFIEFAKVVNSPNN